METNNLNAKIINLDEVETTSQLMNAVDMEEVLQFTKVNQSQDKALFLQRFEFGEVGFERKSDWMRLVNKLNHYDETQLKNMITGRNKKSLDWGGMTVSRTDITYSEDGFQIDFAEPVQLLLETIGDKAVVVEVSQLKGEITYEWSYYRNSHQDLGNYAGVLEVYIHNVEIIK